jgi:anti-sigma-K factor RskA
MNCAEFNEQLAAYVLGALEQAEMAEMRRHLAQTGEHEGCIESLERAEQAAAELGLALAPVAPSERVWRGIERQLNAPVTVRKSITWREGLAYSIAAAAAAFLVIANDRRAHEHERAEHSEQLLASALSAAAERDQCRKELEALRDSRAPSTRDALALLEKPSTQLVVLAPLPGKTYHASAIVNLAEGRTFVVASAMPRPPDKDFQLWVIRGKEAPVPAGLMHTSPDGSAVGEVDPKALQGDRPNAIAISLEPLGGAATPTEVIAAGAVSG